MPDYDGEVIIHAELDKGDFENNIDRLTRLLEEKKAQIENLKAEYASYMDRISKTKEQLYLEQEITKLQKERQAIYDKLTSPNIKFDDIEILQKNLQELDYKIKIFNKELLKVKLHPESTQSVKDLKKEISEATKEAKDLQNKLDKAYKNQGKTPKEKISGIMDNLLNTTTKFGAVFKNVFGTLTSPINSVISGITTLGKRILRLGSYVLIFNVIRGGFRQFRDYVTAALSTNDTFMASLNKVKSNLMVAFYPIYQFILPALNNLMAFLSKSIGYVANFLSMITGTSIKQSEAGAKAIYAQQQAMKSTGAATDSATKSIKDQKAAFDKLGKSVKGGKKELASFDKLIVLHQDKEKKALKTPKVDNFAFTPDTKIPEPDLKWMDDFNKKLQEKLKPTIESFKILGDAIKDKLGGFAKKAGEDFAREYLDPMSDYIFKEAIPKFNRITTDMINNTDWDNLNASLNNFWKSLEPFSETIGDGLLEFYENAIAPLTQWAVGNLLPAVLDLLSGALDFLNPIARQAGDYLGRLWDTFFRPAAEWTGELIVNALKGIGAALSTIGEWINNNSWFVETCADLIIGITTAIAGYNAVIFVSSGGLLALATGFWSAAAGAGAFLASLATNPITWIVVAIGALIAALIAVVMHWDDIKAWFSKNFPQMGELVRGFCTGIVKVFGFAIDKITEGLNWLIQKINSISFDLPGWLGGGHIGVNIPEIGRGSVERSFGVNIPRLAQGAVLEGGNPMLAYLNDQPRGQTNIETPLNTMVQAFNEALSRNNNSPGNVVIQADGDVAGIVNMLRFSIKQRDELIGTNYIQDGIFA